MAKLPEYTSGILILLAAIGAVYLTGLFTVVGAVGFAIAQLLGIIFLSKRISAKMVDFIKHEAIALKKAGGVILITNPKYRRGFDSLAGVMDLYVKLVWTHLAIVLLLYKYLSQNTASDVARTFIIALIASVALSAILAPLTLPYWVIFNTRIRILDPRKALLERVGKLLRSIYKPLFGVANLAVLLFLLLDMLRSVGDFTSAINAYIFLVSLVFGAIGIGSFITVMLLYALKRDDINVLLDNLENGVKDYAASVDEALTLLRSIVVEEEGEKIIEELEKTEETKEQAMVTESEEEKTEEMVEEEEIEETETEETTTNDEESPSEEDTENDSDNNE